MPTRAADHSFDIQISRKKISYLRIKKTERVVTVNGVKFSDKDGEFTQAVRTILRMAQLGTFRRSESFDFGMLQNLKKAGLVYEADSWKVFVTDYFRKAGPAILKFLERPQISPRSKRVQVP